MLNAMVSLFTTYNSYVLFQSKYLNSVRCKEMIIEVNMKFSFKNIISPIKLGGGVQSGHDIVVVKKTAQF